MTAARSASSRARPAALASIRRSGRGAFGAGRAAGARPADDVRPGGDGGADPHLRWAPSALGSRLRACNFGNLSQLGKASRELLARLISAADVPGLSRWIVA
jgi:hypothetical protein